MILLPGTKAMALLLLAAPSTTNAFAFHGATVHTPSFHSHSSLENPRRGTQHRSSLGDQGWKNDNFLDALSSTTSSSSSPSSGPDYEALERVNTQYNLESEGRAAMRQRQFQTMMSENGEDGGGLDPQFGGTVDGMPTSVPKFEPIEEDSQGGSMFKKLMERAEMAKKGVKPPRPSPDLSLNPPPLQQEQPAVPQPPPSVAAPTNAAAAAQPEQPTDPQAYYQLQLQAWQQQVATYTEFIAANPAAASTITMPPPPPPPPLTTYPSPPPIQATTPPPIQQPETPQTPPTTDSPKKDPRDYLPPNRNGNNDSFEITNSADVYLAQLKRDTAVRAWAREDGDIDLANKPFADEGVQAIGGMLSDELVEVRREQRRVQEEGGADKEKVKMIEEMQNEDKRRAFQQEETEKRIIEDGGGAFGLSYKERLEENKRKRAGLPPKEEPVAVIEKVVPLPPQQPAVAVSPVTIEDPVERVAPPPPQQPEVTVEPVSIAADPATLQAPSAPPTSFPSMEAPDTEGTPQLDFALPIKDEKSIAPVSAPSSKDSDETRRSLRTLMGLILKHRGGPGFGSGRLKPNEAESLQDCFKEVLNILRSEAGIPVVVGTDVEIESTIDASMVDVGRTEAVTPSSSLVLDEAVLACVKGAIGAYESTRQESLLMPLRNALLSAAGAINVVIAEGEVENAKQYETKVQAAASPVRKEEPIPQPEVQAVSVPAPVEEVSVDSAISSNTERLQLAYDALKASEGGGKFGLKKGISEVEISRVSDVLLDMRAVIMEELDTGIPEPVVSQAVETKSAPSGTSGGPSRFEQMLAKAKAEEAARNN